MVLPMFDQLASHRVTLTALIGIGAGVLASNMGWVSYTTALAVPLALFALNLVAAIIARPAFRKQPALLIFHLALLAVVLLVAASRLTHLTGWAEVRTGEEFAGRLENERRAPWHVGNIAGVRFVNEGFSIDYATGGRRRETSNRVSFLDAQGVRRSALIGDEHPLELAGYRFYTSSNKGFAATFTWEQLESNEMVLALVSFPSYPAQALRQSYEMQLPGGEQPVWAQLQLPEHFMPKSGPTQFHVPQSHTMIIRHGNQRHELRLGEDIRLGQHRLRYVQLDTWMGYWVHYDWTRPWMLAAVVVAVASLIWYVTRRFSQITWMR